MPDGDGQPGGLPAPPAMIQGEADGSVEISESSITTSGLSGIESWSGGTVAEDDELVGQTLSGTYQIVRVLGEGGMGRVYEARHTRIANKRFAVKTLHGEYKRQPEILKRFEREAEAAASISSPHVCGVYDVGETPSGQPFMVAELLDGQEYGDLLDEVGRMPVGPTARIVRQICKALAAAHVRGVVHRDVKPENVFLTGDPHRPEAKVIDFGISRLDGLGGSSLTKTGMVMGTPSYMAPEQAKGARVDHRVDIYATGAILYRALTGRPPFEKDDATATVVAVLTEEPRRPRELEPTIPEHLELIIQRAMAKNPDDRYQSLAELDADLAAYDPDEMTATMVSAAVGQPSLLSLEDQASEVQNARPVLVALLALGAAALVTGLLTTIGGLIRLSRGGAQAGVSTGEWLLALLVILCTLATPAFFVIRHLRRTIWGNTAKVLELTKSLRQPFLAGIGMYGFAALLLQLVEPIGFQAVNLAWPMWDVLLFVLALGAALATLLVERQIRSQADSPFKRLGDPLLLAAPLGVLAALVILIGVAARPGVAAVAATAAPGASSSAATADTATGEPTAATAKSAAAGASGSRPAPNGASDKELAAATKQGARALQALVARHPQDPRIYKALVLAFAQSSSKDSPKAALKWAKQLFSFHLDSAADREIQAVILGVADKDDASRELAFDLMSSHMGSHGPDLLYEVWLTRDKLKPDAEQRLNDPAVQKRATKALLIAWELQQAPDCAAKQPLLGRAAKDGDRRTLEILEPLLSGKCGPFEVDELRQAVEAIKARL